VGAKFCVSCGHALTGSREPDVVDLPVPPAASQATIAPAASEATDAPVEKAQVAGKGVRPAVIVLGFAGGAATLVAANLNWAYVAGSPVSSNIPFSFLFGGPLIEESGFTIRVALIFLGLLGAAFSVSRLTSRITATCGVFVLLIVALAIVRWVLNNAVDPSTANVLKVNGPGVYATVVGGILLAVARRAEDAHA
jgi:hypothetical protein